MRNNERIHTKDLFDVARYLNLNNQEGAICDADTILADILEDRGRKAIEETGIAEDVFTIWEKARDKKAVEEMFEVLCDCSFQEYFGKCIQQITRSNCSCWGRIGGAYHES